MISVPEQPKSSGSVAAMQSSSSHMPKPGATKEKRMLVTLTTACLVVSGIAIIAALAVFYWFGVRQTPDQVLGVQQEQLIDQQTGSNLGRTRKEHTDGVWRVFATVKLEQPPSGTTYRGWFKNVNSGSMRYTGEFFPTQDGEYSLTYTTQEDVSSFTTVQVSAEKDKTPPEPSNNLVQWEFGNE